MRDWVSEGHLVHFILDAVSLLDLSAAHVNHRGSGDAQYPSATMLALLIYSYATGTFSSRQIERSTYESVPVRYLCAGTHLIRDRLRRAHSLFLEANYDTKLLELDTRRPWATKQRISSRHGHLSNEQVAELVESVAHEHLHYVMLGHLSDDCNDPAIAIRHVRQVLDRAGLHEASVACAERYQPSPTIEVARRVAEVAGGTD
jgi:hypothetical protein